jgi:5-methylcytosine-specific restriction endonuclease McrA
MRVRGRANGRLARALWIAHAGKCWRCGDPIDPTLPRSMPGGLTIGHVIPRSLGGSDHWDNLAPEHCRCNLEAGNRPPRPRPNVVTP